jgi:hypothetical protein
MTVFSWPFGINIPGNYSVDRFIICVENFIPVRILKRSCSGDICNQKLAQNRVTGFSFLLDAIGSCSEFEMRASSKTSALSKKHPRFIKKRG